MDTSVIGLIRSGLPNVPYLVKNTTLSIIGQSANSEHQDVLTQFIVNVSKPILQTPAPLLKSQIHSCTDRGIGRSWVAKCTIQKPYEDGIFNDLGEDNSSIMSMRSAVEFAIKTLDKTDECAYDLAPLPELIDVGAEWTFYRPDTLPISIRNQMTEEEWYHDHMQHMDPSGPTIIHFHGGAFCLMDPSTHRWTTSSLAKHSGGRVLNVRYRLSPQNVFPAALLDAFQTYLALISPPPGAFHQPVSSSQIVISGDSSGGCLAASLMLLLVTLARHNISITYNGNTVKIPSPPCAGLTVVSPWLDVTRSLPATTQNNRWDIIAPPPLDAASPPFPPDSIWPTSPPRAETYTTAYLVTHPLVSPVAAHGQDWTGVPPVYISCGWEGFTDEVEVFARRVYSSSATARVDFEGWQGMPHCFQVMAWNKAGRVAMANWGRFCAQAVANDGAGIRRSDTGTWTSSRTHKTQAVKFTDLGMLSDGSCGYVREIPLDDETVDGRMEKGRVWRIGLEEEMIRQWKQDGGTSVNVL